MNKIIVNLKVHFFVLWVLLISEVRLDDDILLNGDNGLNLFFRTFIMPLMRRIKENPIDQDATVENAIKNKVLDLRPYLQDDDINESDTNNLKFEGKDETTILEFVPTKEKAAESLLRTKINDLKPFKANVQNYKKIKNKINRILTKEGITDNTKSQVINILDDLIAKSLERQCFANNSDIEFLNKTLLRDSKSNLDHSLMIAKSWLNSWETWKSRYAQYIPPDDGNENDPASNVIHFFDQFYQFFAYIIKDVKTLSKRYNIRCKFFRKRKEMTSTIARRRIVAIVDNCLIFKLCTDELTQFLIDFYHNLKSKFVSTFQNYEAMFKKDANLDDSNEKEAILEDLHDFTVKVKRSLDDAFIDEINSFEVNVNKDREGNLNLIRLFVNDTIVNVRTRILSDFVKELSQVGQTKIDDILKDINVNLNSDLNDTIKETLGQICESFESCNGMYNARRSSGQDGASKSNYYVQVLVASNENEKETTAKKKHKIKYGIMNYSNKYPVVTRTTLISKTLQPPRGNNI